MKLCAVAGFLVCVTLSFADENPNDDSMWTRDGIQMASNRFVQTTMAPHPDDKSIIAINHESEFRWWGMLKVVNRSGDKVNWVASVPESYVENRGHYVLSMRWVFLKQLNQWVLETFESTHMGNGSMWLLALEGQKLRVLMQATAVDHHWGDTAGEIFRDGRLAVEYVDDNPEKPVGVKLYGIIDTLADDNKISASRNVSQLWLWDSARKVFVKNTG